MARNNTGDGFVLTIDASEVIKNLGKLIVNTPEVVAPAVHIISQEVAGDTLRVTPKKRGILRSSIRVPKPTIRSGVIQNAIRMGGASGSYAPIVHFQDDTNKQWTTPGTGRLFLEKTLFLRGRTFPADLADEIDLNKAMR